MHALTIAATPVTQIDGLYSLNDLHKAAGAETRHQPHEFLRIDQTRELIAELSNSGDSRNYVRTKRGATGGTYVCRELVIAYAAWISPAFHLKVIRHFLDHADSQRDAATPTALPHYITQEQAGALRAAMETRFPEGKHRPYAWSRFANHFKLAPSQKGERAYRTLPASRFAEALSYIAGMPTKAEAGAVAAPDALASMQQASAAAIAIGEQLLQSFSRMGGNSVTRRWLLTFPGNTPVLTPVEPDAWVGSIKSMTATIAAPDFATGKTGYAELAELAGVINTRISRILAH